MIYVISHNDLDGISSSIVIQNFFIRTESVFTKHNAVDFYIDKHLSKIKKGDILFICDIGPQSDEIIEQINEKVEQGYLIYVIDHHNSEKYLNKYPWAYIHNAIKGRRTCAAEMVYIFLTEKLEMPVMSTYKDSIGSLIYFIELVRHWDTWEWIYQPEEIQNNVKDFNELLELYDYNRFVHIILEKLIANDMNINQYEKTMLDLNKNKKSLYINEKYSKMVKRHFSNYTIGICYAENYISELGDYCLENDNSLDIVFTVDSLERVILRTHREDIDLSEIALRYGGGGHKKAAGFSLNENFKKKFFENFILNNVII